MKKKGYWYLALFFTFLIGNHGGYVALWTNPGGKPSYISGYSVTSLPLADQQAVNRGIRLDTECEMRQLLEDYLS